MTQPKLHTCPSCNMFCRSKWMKKKKNRPNSPTLVIKEEQHTDRGWKRSRLRKKKHRNNGNPRYRCSLQQFWPGQGVQYFHRVVRSENNVDSGNLQTPSNLLRWKTICKI